MEKQLTVEQLQRILRVAQGDEKADLVLKSATYLNVFTEAWDKGDIALCEGMIVGIGQYDGLQELDYSQGKVVPGLMDGHIHLESSLLSPAMFARCVTGHGTTAVVCDPHEIANVMGKDGVRYMLEATEGLPLDVFVALPSCVPATGEDESCAPLTAADLEALRNHPRICALAEMMNYPGLLNGDENVLQKLLMARREGLPIDGHAPFLTGKALQAYIASGVQSDHECTTLREGMEKLENGQWVMLREGTAAHNLDALLPLLRPPYAARCLLVTDDKHPAELKRDGHMDGLVRMAVERGADEVLAWKAASWNTAQAFGLKRRGAVAPGYIADLIWVDDRYQVQTTLKDGKIVYADGQAVPFADPMVDGTLRDLALHSFHMEPVESAAFVKKGPLGVIRMVDGEIITLLDGMADQADADAGINKIAVLERHHATGHVGVGYLEGYGLQNGAIATSVAHDSHNLIVVGVNDQDMAVAAERVRQLGGGIVLSRLGKVVGELPLPIAGLMTDLDADGADQRLAALKEIAYQMGVRREVDPFMTLSFMSLPVIPEARILTHGVFNVTRWEYV